MTTNNIRQKLRSAVSAIEANDKKLAEELAEVRKNPSAEATLESFDTGGGLEGMDDGFALETIVLRTGRPVLTVYQGEATLAFNDAESEVWRDRLTDSRQQLIAATQSVGRIELENHPTYDWVGTGWLVGRDVVVTNRHVAEIFGRSNGAGFIFRQGFGNRAVEASIDFLEEADNPADLTFKIEKILHIEDAGGPDMALLRVRPVSDKNLPPQISLADFSPAEKQLVAVIGYPARDSRIPEPDLMFQIFGDVYNKKRLAPGQLISANDKEILHDCSTLGGNSGSVVLDLASGMAVGLHFAGRFLESNSAVPASLIRQRVEKLDGIPAKRLVPDQQAAIPDGKKPEQQAQLPSVTPKPQQSNMSVTFTIPLEINISIGTPVLKPAEGGPASSAVSSASAGAGKYPDGEEDFFTEGVPEDYTDRQGYNTGFLGSNAQVPLPEIGPRWKDDILPVESDKKYGRVLNYEHFSVVMCKSRRMCFYSAVNIDGKSSVGMKRVAWRLDPRIKEKYQIIRECYGNPPQFSRGHMTRREDPIWGSEASAAKGNADSMHVTNTVPQMQGLNGGIWLALENFALQNARKDDQRISVFTGPVLADGDTPTQHSAHVVVPRSFWKVIAFIHDDTKKLCATGFVISQEEFLEGTEFVYEGHPAQVSIASIEEQTGLSFGKLTDLDPLASANESLDAFLTDPKQIRFF